jgi:hypothetical protein
MHPTSRPLNRPESALRGQTLTTALVSCLLALAACERRTPLSGLPPDELTALLADGDLGSSPLSLTTPGNPAVDPAGAAASTSSLPLLVGSGPNCFPGDFPCRHEPLARWDLDDCSSFRTELRDSVNAFFAFRSVGAACVPGAEGKGISLPSASDLIYAPDQPQFTLEQGVTIAAWVKADKLGGSRTLFRKREGLTSSVALMTVGENFVFVINRVEDGPASVSAPAPVGRFVHVAATYDGEWLRLYLDGVEAATEYAQGQIVDGQGPLLFGNDIFQRRFEGTIDKIWFDTQANDPTAIVSQQCLQKPPLLTVNPTRSAPAVPFQTVQFEVSLTNQNNARCRSESFLITAGTPAFGFRVDPANSFVDVASGETVKTTVNVTSPYDAETDADILFSSRNDHTFEVSQATATYVASNVGCHVRITRELMIKDISVVDDPIRTGFTADAADPRRGVWTFKHLAEQLAPTPEAAPAMVERILGTFNEPIVINGFTVQPRPGMKGKILDPWPRKDGQLDLEHAPLRLLAIVNRIDLRHLDKGNAGEGRFVFGFLNSSGSPLEATMMLEYALPATTEADVHAWADAWHALGSLPFPSEEYNAALTELTAKFTGRGVFPARAGGSALNALRTNEVAFGDNGSWEMREFTSDGSGILRPDTIKLTPDRPSFDRTPALAAFINANEEAILKEEYDVPLLLDGKPFLAGSVFNDLTSWDASMISNPEARHKFALNTCNGCHSSQEANVGFTQISNRSPGHAANLSGFLTGTVVLDRKLHKNRVLNDLLRRSQDLQFLACPADQIPAIPPPPLLSTGGASITPRTPTVRDGIFRVH